MEELKKQKLIPAINSLVKAKKPFLGICLGMQLLFETSEEAKSRKGLGLLKGKVIRFKQRGELKVPHMGWNQIKIKNKTKLLSGIEENSFVYFCHSYYPVPMDKEIVAATCDYGASFACAVSKNSIYGVQFHPEKSQSLGLRMLENFVNLC
jgi:glutamine amidotransferase